MVPFGPFRLPVAGGLYWRVLPGGFVARRLQAVARPAVVYLHPWELAPRPQAGIETVRAARRWTLTVGRARARTTLERLLDTGTFGPLRDHLIQSPPRRRFRLGPRGIREVPDAAVGRADGPAKG